MLIDLRKLAQIGKTEENFFFEYEPQRTLTDIPNTEITAPVKINGKVTLTGKHSAYVEGEIVFTLKGECTKCLTETEKEIAVDFAESVSDEEGDNYPLNHDVIDLAKIVDDKIIMSMPVSLLCKEDCKGLCPDCGGNLNENGCKCK